VILAVSCTGLASCRDTRGANSAPPAVRPKVRAFTIDRGQVVRSYQTIGEVYSDRKTSVSSPVMGRILEKLVSIGDRAQAGDVLFRIDTTELERERAILMAKFEEARQLIKESEARIPEAEASAKSLEADLDYAEYNDKRLRNLIEQSSASEHEYRRVSADKRSLESKVDQAKASVSVARSSLEARRATVQVIQAQLQELDGRIADAVVRAPFDCTIEGTLLDVGDWVTSNPVADVLVVSSNLYRLVMLTVPSRYYEGVRSLSAVTVVMPDGSRVEAKVLAVSNVLRSDSKGCLLRTLLPPAMEDVPVGLTLPTIVRVDQRDGAIRVPNEALRRIESRTFVYRIGAGNQLEVVPVGVDLEGDSFTAVTGDLTEGDQIAVGYLEELGEGITVEVRDAVEGRS
jgi:multidrug efflux pump subunit AcrA (membrane-fusion protein)